MEIGWPQPHSLVMGIEMVPERVSFLNVDAIEIESLDQVLRQFATGAGQAWQLPTIDTHYPLYPERGKVDQQSQNQCDDCEDHSATRSLCRRSGAVECFSCE